MGDRLINLKQVIEKTGSKLSTIYHKIKTGDFPPGSKALGRRVWWESEIDALFPPPFTTPPSPRHPIRRKPRTKKEVPVQKRTPPENPPAKRRKIRLKRKIQIGL